jgi:AGCS family alanine or glycine:cation symporter
VESLIEAINSFLWGKFLWIVIIAIGLYLNIRLLFLPLRKIGYAFRQLWLGRKVTEVSGISPLGTLMVSLSATIGTGNIAGVATAIGLGGPGALFWMWFSALLGMATKYAESVCAVHFREKNAKGQYVGGPMYYIKNGMGKGWMWLAVLFAVFGALAGFGIGNTVQAHSAAESLRVAFGIEKHWSALVMMLVVGLVLLGGLRGVARTATALVPFMSVVYLIAGLIVVSANLPAIPDAFLLIVKTAFTGTAATGGFAGAAVALAIEKGIARGVFSNEAGLGSAPIAHAAAESDSAVQQGCVAMLGTFIDTLVICTVTGLAIVVTGVWDGDAKGTAMSQAAFATVLPFGEQIVALSLSLFAFTTILGWSYYSERCVEFLFKHKITPFYRCLWVVVVPIGALMSLDLVWSIADILNGLMAIPNVIALFALSGLVVRLTRDHFKNESRNN